MNGTMHRKGGEFYLDLYEGGELVDQAGPFDDEADCLEAGLRIVDGHDLDMSDWYNGSAASFASKIGAGSR